MRHNRLHRMPTFAFGPILSFVATVAVRILVVRVAAEESESASSETCGNNDNSECTNVCIDGRCMCNPMWGHTGADCSEMTWNSWGIVAVLVLVILYSIHVLHAAAKRGLSSSSKTWSGFAELASIFFMVKRENDSGGATMRAIIGTVVLESSSHVWKILTAIGVISDRTSGYWDGRVFFPLAEGSCMLPSAIVISVWLDVAKSSMSRAKARRRLNKKKKALEILAASYVVLLMVVCVFGHPYRAMVLNLTALALSLLACGSGSAKLCNTLRESGGNNVEIAKKVFEVSRRMGMNFYAMLVGNAMILSSCTRKSNPANLAFLGLTISSIGKCLLSKAIFEYACESARAKRDRAVLARRHRRQSTKPVADMVLTVRSLRNTVKRKAALGLQQSKRMVASIEEDPREHAPHDADHADVAGPPFLPLPDAAPHEPCAKIESKGETASPCLGTDRADAKTSERKGVASDDETSWKRTPIDVPGLLGVGRRLSSTLCLLDPLSQRDDEIRSDDPSLS